MKLYVDESGNTGGIVSENGRFNFTEQPFYVLTGLLMDDPAKAALEKFIIQLKTQCNIQGKELKSRRIYYSKPIFIKELVDYLTDQRICVFTELMDKVYFINLQFVDYFFSIYFKSIPTNTSIKEKIKIASSLERLLSQEIYDKLFEVLKTRTHDSLENFYEVLIDYFDEMKETDLKNKVEETKKLYLFFKLLDPKFAIEKFLPIPDEGPNDKLVHLLPNYAAYANLIARAQKYVNGYTSEEKFSIIHDEQKQFETIFIKTLEMMKIQDSDSLVADTVVAKKATFNLCDGVDLDFVDSTADVTVQVADIIAGFIMRFWYDFKRGNKQNVDRYLPLIKKLHYPRTGSSLGINYVIPDFEQREIFRTVDLSP